MSDVTPNLKYAEFYITNSCNFNCTGCNRFNNYNFAGSQLWSDYADHYRRWAEVIQITQWTILGGEPMMNPTYLEWLQNIIKLWPNASGAFLTNGHYLRADNRELYEIIKSTNGRVCMNIGLHNINRLEHILSMVKTWLGDDISVNRMPKNIRQLPNFDHNWKKSYQAIRDPSWPDCETIDDWPTLPQHIQQECHEVFEFSPEHLSRTRQGYSLKNSHGVIVNIHMEDYFRPAALSTYNNQSFVPHNSDVELAHTACNMTQCHHFVKGKLYKCGVVALLPEFDQQFYIDVSEQDRQLMHSYLPADPDSADLENFVKNLDRPIPQCKFCPEKIAEKQIFAQHGQKTKIRKKYVITPMETSNDT